jgi:hypothetical protein
MQLLSAQLDAYLTDGLWLANARHANAMAARLAAGLTALTATRLLHPVDANELFVMLPEHMHDALQAGGARYHPWPSSPSERVFRLVTAFDTNPAEVDRFLAIAEALRPPDDCPNLRQNVGDKHNPRFVRQHHDALGFRVFTGARSVSSVSRRQR